MNDGLGWSLGKVAGVPVFLSRSWLIIFAIIVITFGPTAGWMAQGTPGAGYLIAAIYAISLLGSVFVHELAHALTARACGMTPKHIALTLWGGHTQFSTENPRPGASFLTAAAGPVANLGLAGLGYLLAQATINTPVVAALSYGFYYTNLFVGAFNLLPGLPLDGGAMLEAAVWKISGNRSAGTRIAAYLGMATAAGVLVYAFWPLFTGGTLSILSVVWGLMIAGMLWAAARQALAVAQIRARASNVELSTLLAPARVWPASAGVHTLASTFGQYPGLRVFIHDDAGAITGEVNPQALYAAAAQPDPVPLSAVSVVFPGDRVVDIRSGTTGALAAFQGDANLPVLVSYPDQGVVGYVTLQRLSEALDRS